MLLIIRSVCAQVQTDIHVNSTKQTLQGVAFPLDGDAFAALQQFKDKTLNYVQLVRDAHGPQCSSQSTTKRFWVDICCFISKEHQFWEGADRVVEHGRHGGEGSAQADPQRRGALSLLPLQTLARGRLPGVCRYTTLVCLIIRGRSLVQVICDNNVHFFIKAWNWVHLYSLGPWTRQPFYFPP